MRIFFLIGSLAAGGAERVISTLANDWRAKGHEIHVLTFSPPSSEPHYPLRDGVIVHNLGRFRQKRSWMGAVGVGIQILASVRAVLKDGRPDIVVSFITEANIIAVLASLGLKIPVIVSERIHPQAHPVGRMVSILRKILYPKADAVIVQTRDIAEWVQRELRLTSSVIRNPVRLTDFSSDSLHMDITGAGEKKDRRLVAVGRLTRQKGFDLLIEAFAKVASRNSDWTLTIYGEGPAREALEAAVRAHNLEGRVLMPGLTDNVVSALHDADVYVMSSRYEGFPNALVEALASGLCCVAFDCPGANRELLADGKYGLLAAPESVDSLAEKLSEVMMDDELRERYARNAVRAVSDCDIEVVSEIWIGLIREILDRHGRTV